MTFQLFPSFATLAFAAVLSVLILKRRSRKINGGEADEDAATDGGTAGGASSTHTSTEGQGIATSSGYDYEVFLSFRGPDTRAGFTDFLYTSLTDAGIRTFKDDEDLRKGEEFAPNLLQAIEQSKILVPIFSKGYAASVWCLKEVAKMVECKKTGGQKIIPIFYDVAPAEVRYQTGVYKKSFLLHERKKRHEPETIENWKAALNAVGEINGHDLQSMSNGRQGEFVKIIRQKILNELKKASLAISGYLVRVDNHVDRIMQMIGSTTSETRIIGIHGMGGIGKTTIAKIIFNNYSLDFENRCFLSNIRETSQNNGIQHLQNQLISEILKIQYMGIKDIDDGRQTIKDRLFNKRVLLLLDDVEEENHIYALVGNRDWLGEGSKIIITTRRIDVLDVPEVDDMYELTHMDSDQSLQLFSKHAFRRDSPLDDYIHQSNRAIDIAGGLPLALEVIGSLLYRTKKGMWDATLKMLESVPPNNIQSKLKISYDALDFQQQCIFLDIACLFIGHKKDILIYFWDESGYFPEVAIDVLENMSLIKIDEYNRVLMHDQLRDLGRNLVRRESEMKMEKQTRVWNPKEALDLLKTHKVETKVEAFRLKLDHEYQYYFPDEDFKRLSNLRFLEVDSRTENFFVEERPPWHESPSNVLPTNVFHDDRNLLPHLRWLSWRDIPPTFNITRFSMENVAILDLSWSKITDNWKGWNHMEVMKNLKVLDLSHCSRLKRTPIFSTHSNLEHLILYGCYSLIEIDRSIWQLKRLVYLAVCYCENLLRWPNELGGGLASLEYLSLAGCPLSEGLPDTIGNLESLMELDISSTFIKELPDSIEKLKNLKIVKMENVLINKIPDAIWMMEKVEEIRITFYRDIHVITDNCICRSKSLRTLILYDASIYALPPRLPESLITLKLHELYMDKYPDLSNLTNLKELRLCFDEEYNGPVESLLPGWIGRLTKLESLFLSSSFSETTSPTEICLPPQLQSLRLIRCPNLRCLPRLPSSLSFLDLEDCHSLCSTGDLSDLKNLSSLSILRTAITEIQGLGCLKNLRELALQFLNQVEILPNLSNLNKLRSLQVCDCANLVEIQGELPQFLVNLHISSCHSLRKLPDMSSLMGHPKVDIKYCSKLNVEAIIGLAQMETRVLKLEHFEQLHILPDLSNLRNSDELKHLQVRECVQLIEILGELPQFLEKLEIDYCKSLQQLPNMSRLTRLREVFIRECDNLVELQGELPQSLEKLEIYCCKSLQQLPNMSRLTRLREVFIRKCGNLVEFQGELPQSLEKLEIYCCKSLQRLPNMPRLMRLREVLIHECGNLIEFQGELPQSLENLMIDSCKSLQQLPNMSSLMRLCQVCIRECGNLIELQGELPQSLENLMIDSCKSLQQLPNMSSLKRLRQVCIRECGNLVELQGKLPQSLENLMIDCCKSLQQLPNMSSLMRLREVCIRECGNLIELQGELPQSLEKLEIYCCKSLQQLPNMVRLMQLRQVFIRECGNLVELQGELPQSLENLMIGSCKSLQQLPNMSNLMRLRQVFIYECGNMAKLRGELPQSLENLMIDSCKSLQQLPNFSCLMQLREFSIRECGNLVELQGELPQSLKNLMIDSCKSLQHLPNISCLMQLRECSIRQCDNLVEIQGKLPQSLEKLKFYCCKSLQKLPNMSRLMQLREVFIGECGNLVKIEDKLPQSLVTLEILSCESLQELPALSSSMGLQEVVIHKCGNLVKIKGELPQSLNRLEIISCESLQELPPLSSSMELRFFAINNCVNLVKIEGELPQTLKILEIISCESLEELPALPSSMGLRKVKIKSCRKLDVKAIALVCLKNQVKFVGEDDESKGEDEEIFI